MNQEFINNTFFKLFIFTLLFGLISYGTIGYDGMDEICACLLIVLFGYVMFNSKDWNINKVFLVTLGIFLFYFIYSLAIKSNVNRAIIKDLVIQLKPYVAFFAVYQLGPVFSKRQKSILQLICVACWVPLLILGILSLFKDRIIFDAMFHVSYYAACATALALIYFYCAEGTTKDKIIFILLLSVGLFSTRSKFYGIYALSIMLILFAPYLKDLKFNLKTIFFGLVVVVGIIFVGWQKIDLYFAFSAEADAVETGLIARLMLYATSARIFVDYFPFGSGLGSFASYSSGVYYSDIYAKYGIDKIYGMNSVDYSFIADTYYPCLAQFGVAGVLLFILFFIYLFRKSYQIFKQNPQVKYLIITVLIICYFLIESIADATFTGHRGFFMMLLLGLVFSEQKHELETKRNES
ncbi:hypothetical protein FACS189415_0840 [Bacteroidia bacterium]|nr:hypothetical protein FACS189415_0840 [Bacteroidia bacterium]